jgi:1-acyl-sn-glycerol-3-phosphate acyltransferase
MWKRCAKVFRSLATGSAFLVFFTGGAIMSWLVLPLVNLTLKGDRIERARTLRTVISVCFRWFIGYMRMLGLVRFDAAAVMRQLPEKGPYVLVSNHPTLLDVVFLHSVCPNLCVVVHGRYYHGFSVGPLLRLCNHIDAGDGSALSGMDVVNAAVERLQEGDSVLIFPEGTRSALDTLRPFKSGAFAIACQSGAPIVPVFIRCEPRGLMKGMAWYTVPDGTMVYTMAVKPPIPATPYEGDLKALKSDVQAVYDRELAASKKPSVQPVLAAT